MQQSGLLYQLLPRHVHIRVSFVSLGPLKSTQTVTEEKNIYFMVNMVLKLTVNLAEINVYAFGLELQCMQFYAHLNEYIAHAIIHVITYKTLLLNSCVPKILDFS